MLLSKNKLYKVFVLVSLITSSCGQNGPTPGPHPIPITAVRIVPQTIPANFEYIGVAESSHIVELRARVEGYLEKIAYTEGTLVPNGNLLFIIDQRPFIDELEAQKGDLARQEAILWNAEQSKNRMVPLYKQNAVSQRDYDNAIADELAAKANVMSANANVNKAALNLSFASIQAPVAGMVGKAIYREGALISPGANSLLANLYVVDPIWVNFSVSEGDLLKMHSEMEKGLLQYPKDMNFKIEVILADNSIFPFEGFINFLAPALQQNTGTMLVRSTIPNPAAMLRPGQFVRVVVKGAIRPNAIIVPQTAIQQGQSGMFVYVVTSEGKAEMRPVTTGDWYKDYWIITSGLKQGEIVVAEGVNRVFSHAPVNVTQWLSDTPP